MLITLTTDFGYKDAFVGIMKGVIYTINPQAQLIDLTHAIPAQDITAGALTLRYAVNYFPRGTIHVAVVDPGVGTVRHPLLVEADGSYFIGPDNGIFSLAMSGKQLTRVVHLSNPRYRLQPTSATFHGRDIFAPAAAHLSLGRDPGDFGTSLDSIVTFSLPKVIRDERQIQAQIIYIDGYGNLFTNVSERDLTGLPIDRLMIRAESFKIIGLAENYAATGANEHLAIINSWGLLEIALSKGSAHKASGLKVGDKVNLTWDA